MSKERKEIGRVLKILDRLEAGEDSAKIAADLDRLEANRVYGKKMNERGDLSQSHVRNAILELPFVRSAKISEKHGEKDRDLNDVEVKVKNIPYVVKLKLQVKSSEIAVSELGRELGFESARQFEEWLREEGRIVLNGNRSHEKIRMEFRKKLALICLHHARKKGDEIPDKLKNLLIFPPEGRPAAVLDYFIKMYRLGVPKFEYSVTSTGETVCVASFIDARRKLFKAEGLGGSKRLAQDDAAQKLIDLADFRY